MRTEPATPDAALAAIRAPFAGAGAEPIDPPILQPLGALLDLAGETLRARLFVVQAQGGAEACLRPDFTVPIARLHLERGDKAGRYFYEGRAFRAAPDRSDRAEEFLQIGLELYGDQSADPIAADVEIASLAWRSALAGGRGDLQLWLGDVALFGAFIDALELAGPLAERLKRIAARPRLLQAELARAGAEPAAEPATGGALAAILAGLDEREAAALLEEVWALAGVERVGGRGAAEIAQRLIRRAEVRQAPALTEAQAARIAAFLAIEDEPGAALSAVGRLARATPVLSAALDGWRRRLDLLAAAGVPAGVLRFAAQLGHTFDYYDGPTFEVRSAALGARPVAVGGRYDSLPARLGGGAGLRAVGGMVRPWRAYAGGEA
jgi:ATP phosphoribosyltransferase regulatory subunit